MNTLQKQKQLYYLNFRGLSNSMLALDGIFGPNSKKATELFQSFYGLTRDGIFGINTENKSILIWKDYQKQLNNKGYNLVVDGLVGNNTINAIKDFQRKNNLEVDGIIGYNTKKALMENNTIYMTDNDWKNSKYFKKEEFKCECGGKYCDGYNNHGVTKKLVTDMNKIRERFGKPITITSGVRCQRYNDNLVGSIKNSKHISGNACDFYFLGINTSEVINYCKSLSDYGYAYTNNANMSGAVHFNTNE